MDQNTCPPPLPNGAGKPIEKNYKSDFDLLLKFGHVDGVPTYDWEAKFFTPCSIMPYVASCIGGVCKNCFNDNGRIRVVFKAHRLGAGLLNVEFHSMIPNSIYPGGIQDDYKSYPLGIELVRGAGDDLEEIEAELPGISASGCGCVPIESDKIMEAVEEAFRPAHAAKQ